MTQPALAFGLRRHGLRGRHSYAQQHLDVSDDYFYSMVRRFWTKARISDDCWEWTSSKQRGYGTFHIQNGDSIGNVKAHRLAYWLYFGPFPEHFTIDHLCSNRGCVNPSHLEAVPMAENLRRAAKRRYPWVHLYNMCKYGHSLDDAYERPNGEKRCRTCRNEGRQT